VSARDPHPPDDGANRAAARRADAERRRRRARVFGQVLPEDTRDERAEGWGEPEQSSEEWLRRQVPPHHG
jgi:hypothetical protein